MTGAEHPADLGVVDGLVQLSTAVQAIVAGAAGELDLPVLQVRLLGVLRDREPTMAELSRLLDLDKSSTTGLVDRAQRRGLVRRLPLPGDGRSRRVALTPAGADLAARGLAIVTAALGALTEVLDPGERRSLDRLASRLVRHDAERRGVSLNSSVVSGSSGLSAERARGPAWGGPAPGG